MATRGKRTGKRQVRTSSGKGQQAKRAASRRRAEAAAKRRNVAASSGRRAASRRRAKSAASRRIVAASSSRRAEWAASAQMLAPSSGWSSLRVVWRPAIAMATLPYRVYRVYRWAEAESLRRSAGGSVATA